MEKNINVENNHTFDYWGLLQIILIILKLLNMINISWFCVFLPSIIGLFLVVVICIIIFVVNKMS